MSKGKRLIIVLLVSFLTIFILFFIAATLLSFQSEASISFISRIISASVCGFLVTIFLGFYLFITTNRIEDEIETVEELYLDEHQITEAIRNYIYTNLDKCLEGDVEFSENSDGEIIARMVSRKIN